METFSKIKKYFSWDDNSKRPKKKIDKHKRKFLSESKIYDSMSFDDVLLYERVLIRKVDEGKTFSTVYSGLVAALCFSTFSVNVYHFINSFAWYIISKDSNSKSKNPITLESVSTTMKVSIILVLGMSLLFLLGYLYSFRRRQTELSNLQLYKTRHSDMDKASKERSNLANG